MTAIRRAAAKRANDWIILRLLHRFLCETFVFFVALC
jgi:hypothetical protein